MSSLSNALFCKRISIKFDLAFYGQVDFAHLINWLQVLEFEQPDQRLLDGSDQNQRYLWLGLAFLKGLLQAGNIPHFDFFHVSSVTTADDSSDRARVALTIEPVEYVPLSVYSATVKRCFEALGLLAQLPPDEVNKPQIFQKLFKEVVVPLRSVIPSGLSTMHVLRAAHARGIPFIHLGLGVFQLGWGSRARLFDRSTTDEDSAIGLRLSDDKAAAVSLLAQAGLPHPTHRVLSNEQALADVASQLGFPLVVKPCDQECGVGVSVGIDDMSGLLAAYKLAKDKSRSGRVIVEQQVAGVCHRLFIVHGRLLYAVKRDPITIHGDGVHNIGQIAALARLREEQRPPWCRTVAPPSIENDVLATLAAQGLTLDSVPEKGVPVRLRRIESTAWGGCDEEVTQRIHPDNLAAALRAARLFKLAVAGVDIISTDISVPWYENGAVINELNFAPLLGGAAISRAYIPVYLGRLISGDGKIPVEIFEHEDAWRCRYTQLCNAGQRCFTVTSTGVLDGTGAPVFMPNQTLEGRIRALLLRSDVDAVLVSLSQSVLG